MIEEKDRFENVPAQEKRSRNGGFGIKALGNRRHRVNSTIRGTMLKKNINI
jgi:hypothetical protein